MVAHKQIYKIPQSHEERNSLRELMNIFVGSHSLVPPVSMDNLHSLSEQLINDHSLDKEMKGWLMVELNNCIWKEVVSSIPYNKRILLLPKCLSNSSKCDADIDELGLLCNKCNQCAIPSLQDKAAELGMMSLVAEGFTSVISLIQNRIVDAVIGVGCLDSLEKAFPLLIDNAVPGLAIPLNMAGCKDTTVDYDYVEQMIGMLSDREIELLDYDLLKTSIQEWFSTDNLNCMLTPSKDHTSEVAHEWLGGNGKRWRPYLLSSVYQALSGVKDIPEYVRIAAVAVECFHKASLVHDDIQDNDTERYGRETVNAAYGVPIAINVGDVLLGEGYRLLTKTDRIELLEIATDAHIKLCKGQGIELEWSLTPRSLTMEFVLEIFRNKTVPAFDVSLAMGLICAGDDADLRKILHDYSQALGISYQLFDDMEDFETDIPDVLRPSAIFAALCEQASDSDFIDFMLQTNDLKFFLNQSDNQALLHDAVNQVRCLAERYRDEALNLLNGITNVELKRLLFRVTKRILK